MVEIALLAILALSIVGGYLLSPRRTDAIRRRREERVEFARSEPAEEGARIREEEPRGSGERPREAA